MSNRILLELIKESQSADSKPCKGLESADWDFVYKEAVSQAVIGIVANEVPASVLSGDPRWKQAIYRQQANYARYIHAEDDLKKVMDQAEIPFVILKGNAAAVYYRHPERRKMGDIDFLVPQSEYERAQEVLTKNGYELNNHGENPRHIGYKKNKVAFELHHHFSYDNMEIEKEVVAGLHQRITGKIGSHEFPMLPSEANGLVLLDHMRSHLKSGMGLRQVIDWMMYVNSELHDSEWDGGFEAIVRDKGMRKFAMIVTRMCQMYLGLPVTNITWCREADESLCKRLMTIVMNSGNFGMKNSSGNHIETVTTKFRRNGILRTMQQAGEYNWKAYKKHHWLRPFAWIYQLFRYIRLGLKTGRVGKKMNEDFNRSKERTEVLKEMGI